MIESKLTTLNKAITQTPLTQEDVVVLREIEGDLLNLKISSLNRCITPSDRGLNPGIYTEKELKPNTYYIVNVAFNANNVLHKSILFTGFLHNGDPGNYSYLFNPTYDNGSAKIDEAYCIIVLSELSDLSEVLRDVK